MTEAAPSIELSPRERRLARRRVSLNARRAARRAQLGKSFRRHESEPVKKRHAEARKAALEAHPTCSHCGRDLYIPKTGKVPTMCSKACRQAAWNKARTAERNEAGVCACGAARAPGHIRCQPCHDAMLACSSASKAKTRRARRVPAPPPALPAPPAPRLHPRSGRTHHGAPGGYATCKRAWIGPGGSKGSLDPSEVTCPRCLQRIPLSSMAPSGAGEPHRLPLFQRTRESSFLVYRGPSALNGVEILAIVTGATGAQKVVKASQNSKTGPMAQLYILVASEAPHMAQKSGADAAVCGDCPMRHGTAKGLLCYVETRKGARSTWEAHADSPVRLEDCLKTLRKSKAALRLGAYGDPAALPPAIIQALAEAAEMTTGYTHAWRRPEASWLRPFAMASVERAEDAEAAQAAGWRTFRIVEGMKAPLLADEVLCPTVTHGTRCVDCGLCDGAQPADTRKNVAIPAHGRQRRPEGPLFPALEDATVARETTRWVEARAMVDALLRDDVPLARRLLHGGLR